MSDLPPLTPRDRAAMRAMAHWDTNRAEAERLVDHTFIGAQLLLGEQVRDLGRALAKPPMWLARRPWGRTAWLLACGAWLGFALVLLVLWLAEP
jgi:hypothetical protein